MGIDVYANNKFSLRGKHKPESTNEIEIGTILEQLIAHKTWVSEDQKYVQVKPTKANGTVWEGGKY